MDLSGKFLHDWTCDKTIEIEKKDYFVSCAGGDWIVLKRGIWTNSETDFYLWNFKTGKSHEFKVDTPILQDVNNDYVMNRNPFDLI